MLNRDFYQLHAGSFSESRKTPWKGWDEVVNQIEKLGKKEPRVLDLGSGNGRFYGYLKRRLNRKFEYVGIDNSDALMSLAKEMYGHDGNFKQKKLDVITELEIIDGEYDAVVAFGLTHHIPSEALRKGWFKKITGLVANEGLFASTFWSFKAPLEVRKVPIDTKFLDKGDVILGWNGARDAFRFAHLYSDSEINDVITKLKQHGFILIKKYISDQSKKSSNLYLIFKKN